MAKAEIKLPNGTHVRIDGTSEEIAKLLDLYSSKITPKKKKSRTRKNTIGARKKKISRRRGPVGLIKELIEEGYFKSQKRTLPDIQKKLEERGHIYAQTSLSPALTRLTRKRVLRRIKEKKGWVYVV